MNWHFICTDRNCDYAIFRMINVKGHWKAMDYEVYANNDYEFDIDKAFDITYQQALGYEPIESNLKNFLGERLFP